jgi:16S rRNA (cytosine1402-N4)-methyltransferase
LEVLNGMEKESQPTVYCIHSNFSELGRVIKNIRNYTPINEINESNANNTLNEINELTCIYADLGVSSVHFDTPERGFSFRFDGPLDMRLDSSRGETAADLINTFSYEKMAEIFRVYGDESRAGFIAKKIIEARTITPIKTTKELAEIVIKAWRDSLPRIFQALRIAVNDEYRSLETMLQSAHDLLVPGGTLSVIAFHSGEDRIVKHFLKTRSAAEIDPITGQDISS